MSRRGENIYKRKDGRWEGRYIKHYSSTGKAVYGYVYARTYHDVKEALEVSKSANRSKPSVQVKSTSLLADIAQNWLYSIEVAVKESSFNKYSNLIANYIQPTLGQLPISEICTENVDAFLLELSTVGGKRKKGLSQKTVSDIFSVLRRILVYASQKGYQLQTLNPKLLSKREINKIRVLTNREQEQLRDYLLSHQDRVNVGILLCLFSGLRIGELCALKWEDISVEEQTIRISRTMQRIQNKKGSLPKTKIVITTPKSSCSIRTIPLPDEVSKLLSVHRGKGYLLTGAVERYMEPRTMQNRFKRVTKLCGIKDANFHALRHSFATRCVELGFDVKSLSEILGHSSVTITMNRYVHPTMDMKKQNMQRLSKLFSVK